MHLPHPFVWSRGRSASAAVVVATLLVGGFTSTLVGCGGSEENDSAYTLPSAAVYSTGEYTTRASLRDGTAGTLVVYVNADNTVHGTFTPDGRGANSRLVIDTPYLSGTFNEATGAISLSSTYSYNGQTFTLSVQGILPVPPSTSGGSVTFSINGERFSRTWTVTYSGIGSPSPVPTTSPSPSPSPSPVVTPSPSPSPVSGNATGDGDVFFLNPSGTPTTFDSTDIRASNQTATIQFNRTDGSARVVITEVKAGTIRVVTLSLNTLPSLGILTPGNFSILDTSGNGLTASAKGNALIGYGVTDNATDKTQFYLATQGTVVLENITTNSIKLYFENVQMEANTGTTNNGQSGTFHVSGVINAVLK